ncbi:hypothetical protein HGG82_09900 [Marinomonas sp. M1K-6]|uniref:SWIM-type domain-containing protein n=1 Tax=Marinomonas profundi TaxID=2726122 RepID=A0A847RCL8_9GAMM|nr:hypothetical protein [Marinomonas profundi]NLQ17940.1 hypothetical protein [Marinomonas profundi]UDV01668.1 hypothetical protein J8N69_08535 [Marinomonas profundi]
MTDLIRYLQALTYDDLETWAGSTIFERGKGLTHKVMQLHLGNDDQLNARVQGSELYDCRVFLEGSLESDCSCPYSWGHCKHAVALILAAAKVLTSGQNIPTQAPEENTLMPTEMDQERLDKDARIKSIREKLTNSGLNTESVLALPSQLYRHQDLDEDEADEDIDFHMQLRRTLNALTKGKLIQLLMEMAEDDPDDILFDIRERADALSTLDPKKQIANLRHQIKKITAQESWQNHWDGTGFTPSYGPIERGLTALLEQGQFDEVIALGKELWTMGIIQVGNSGDEGETAEQLCSAMQPVYTALANSSLSPVDQLLWLIDHELSDEYCILYNIDLPYEHASYQETEWRSVARILGERLDNQRKALTNRALSFSERYQYKNVLQHLLSALEKLHDQAAILTIMENNIDITEDYRELVTKYLTINDAEKAKKWITIGFKNTSSGAASSLKKLLVEQLQKEGKNHEVAALLADDYFTRPDLDRFKQQEELCQSLSIWQPVRNKLIDYLDDGTLPEPDWDETVWPLPAPLLTRFNYNANRQSSPSSLPKSSSYDLLKIDIALHEKRFAAAAELFEQLPANAYKYQSSTAKMLARKVAATHPDLAITIWLNKAEAEIGKVNPKNYPTAGEHLKQIHLICQQQNTLPRWEKILSDVRQRHKAKKRLQEVLNRFAAPGKKLVE